MAGDAGYAQAAGSNLRVFALVIAVAAAPILIYVCVRAWRLVLRRQVERELGPAIPPGLEVKRLAQESRPGRLILAFPRWASSKADGTRDLRTRDESIVRPPSVVEVGHWRIESRDPLALYAYACKLRAAGSEIAPCAEETEKLARLKDRAQAQSSARSIEELIGRFKDSPTDFESLCAGLVRSLGWDAHVTPPSHDGGFDLRLVNRKTGFTAIAECKLYAPDNPVGRPLVQKLRGANASAQADGMIFFTTSSYTAEARAYAAETDVRLVDGNELLALCRRSDQSASSTSRPTVQESDARLTPDELLAHYPTDMLADLLAQRRHER